jgi:hypothetical protein
MIVHENLILLLDEREHLAQLRVLLVL